MRKAKRDDALHRLRVRAKVQLADPLGWIELSASARAHRRVLEFIDRQA
jgi:hypothetical protein